LNLPVTVLIDNSGLAIPRYPQSRARSISLHFSQFGDMLQLTAYGPAFPNDGGGQLHGVLSRPASAIKGDIGALRNVWSQHVIKRCEGSEAKQPKRYPYAESWNLSTSPAYPDRWADVGRRLARAGHQLYTNLFENGDGGLQEIGRLLRSALAGGEQVIDVHSETLFAPWSMLYTPPRSDTNLEAADATWELDGFWGYRHHIEQCLKRARGFDSRIVSADGRLVTGMNIDRGLDDEFPNQRCVQPMIEFFGSRTEVEIRETREALAASFGAAAPEQISYYACHCTVSGSDGASASQPKLKLGDKEEILTADYEVWLLNRTLTPGPIVFVNGCQGGQLASQFFISFGEVLLRHGANCLIGPQVDVPPLFAGMYANRFFEEFLAGGVRIGDVVRDLARELADTCHNPLGLAISLYRGLDTHLAPQD
jgi:hypothetical protein